jgi:hypothetical protein
VVRRAARAERAGIPHAFAWLATKLPIDG